MPMEIEHLVPEVMGGPTIEDNLWLACSPCNGFKGVRISARDPQTDEVVALFNPRHQRWSEHFAWKNEGELIIGLTKVGRATVVALQLNRELLVEARKIWIATGQHPPAD
jgi:5-methylcytosine-specific restriction endonuclease McrA